MKDCVLAVLWPRQDIYTFFADHGCTKNDLRILEGFEEKNLNRSQMIDLMFGQLSSAKDGGLGQFRAMLQSLLKWSRFDPYYFDKLRKLDLNKAQQCLDHLRQLQEIRDAKIKADRERRAAAEAAQQKSGSSIEELKGTFLDLHAGKTTPQKRGYAFETILVELSKLAGLEVTEAFRVNGEQIDGALKFEGEHYIIEAKWQDKAAANEPVYQFVGKVEGKMYGRGIFVSVHGFSDYVVTGVVAGKAIKTIFVDGEDVVLVLEGHLSFSEMLDRKIKAAQTRGLIYVHPITGMPKV
jgi:Restriction endonuclease